MFTNPEKNVLRLGLKEGMRVADFGSGSGFYTRVCSERVGQSGKVYAIEIQKDLVKRFENDIKSWGLTNVFCIWGDIERVGGTKIKDGTMDAVIISNVFFQVEDKLGLIDEAHRVLKKEGEVLFIEWKDSFNGMGPDPKNIIPEETAKELFKKRGFKFIENISTNIHHYGIIFKHE